MLHRDVLLVVLSPVAHADRALDLRLANKTLTLELVDRRSDHTVEMRSNRLRVDGVGAEMLAPDLGDLRLSDERAEGGCQSRIDRNHDLSHPHLSGDVG